MFAKLLLDIEMNDAGHLDKNAFKTMILPNNLILICRF